MPPHFEAAVPLGGPLLSAGEGVIGLIVVALTIASWIVNVVSQYSQAKPQPVVRPRGNRPQDSDATVIRSTFGEQDRTARQNSQKKNAPNPSLALARSRNRNRPNSLSSVARPLPRHRQFLRIRNSRAGRWAARFPAATSRRSLSARGCGRASATT